MRKVRQECVQESGIGASLTPARWMWASASSQGACVRLFPPEFACVLRVSVCVCLCLSIFQRLFLSVYTPCVYVRMYVHVCSVCARKRSCMCLCACSFGFLRVHSARVCRHACVCVCVRLCETLSACVSGMCACSCVHGLILACTIAIRNDFGLLRCVCDHDIAIQYHCAFLEKKRGAQARQIIEA